MWEALSPSRTKVVLKGHHLPGLKLERQAVASLRLVLSYDLSKEIWIHPEKNGDHSNDLKQENDESGLCLEVNCRWTRVIAGGYQA